MKQYTDEQLKKELENRGYFTRNLWCEEDVTHKTEDKNLTKEQVQNILHNSLTNDATMEQIWFSIETFIDEEVNN